MRSWFSLLTSALLLSGCVAAGTQIKESQLSQFNRGESSYQDVISKLGNPNSATVTADGGRTACYRYVQSTARPESFIPIVGAFVGGADTHVSFTCFTFDTASILTNYTATTSNTGAGYGFESGNGVAQDRVASEPRHAD